MSKKLQFLNLKNGQKQDTLFSAPLVNMSLPLSVQPKIGGMGKKRESNREKKERGESQVVPPPVSGGRIHQYLISF